MNPETGAVGLEYKISPERAALLVIDVQNDFCAEGGMMDQEGHDLGRVRDMVPHLASFLEAARFIKLPVIFIKNIYNTAGDWFMSDAWLEQARRRRGNSYSRYRVCEPDSWGGDFYGGIEPLPGDPVVVKHRFSGFYQTDLEMLLRCRKVETVIVTGVATNVCVDSTVRDAFFRDFYVVVVSDCCATYNDEAHRFTLENLDRFFGEVIESRKIVRFWKKKV